MKDINANAAVAGATTTASKMASILASAAFSCSCGWWAATSLGMAGCALAFSALVASSIATLAATWEVRSESTTGSTFAGEILHSQHALLVTTHCGSISLLPEGSLTDWICAYVEGLRHWAEH